MSNFIGPAIPPNFKPAQDSSSDSDEEKSNEELNLEENVDSESANLHTLVCGPQLPHDLITSQELPSEKENNNKNSEQNDTDTSTYGPALPPGFKKNVSDDSHRILGPQLPVGYQAASSESSDDDVIGPMLPTSSERCQSEIHSDFERRSQKMKKKLTVKEDEAVQRESWMTELPEEKSKAFGLGPRTFMKRSPMEQKGDRSGWTDTPEDVQKKMKNQSTKRKSDDHSLEDTARISRDKEISKIVDDHNSKSRSESLVDIHLKKRKKQKNKSKDEPAKRQPFDREKDLQVNKFDDAKRKVMMKKAQGLSTRFSHSSVSSNFL